MQDFVLERTEFEKLPDVFFSRVKPEALEQPYWIAKNLGLATELGLPTDFFNHEMLLYLSGSAKKYNPAPIATVYAGHQFGGYSPQLGDGRALLLGDWQDGQNQRWEWQLKGSGRTPYSRFADGRAVLRSSVREYLCSEAMHGLGIATTRALALAGSNDTVFREEPETAAVLTRVSSSFIRFGHFEYFYHHNRHHQLKTLADFVIEQYYPECATAKKPYLMLFRLIMQRTVDLTAAWQSVGFCHGVLNTDNISVLGLTMDYGPFGFLDIYDRTHICNHSDTQGRYAYQEQPYVMHWNLARLASCFLPLADEADLVAAIDEFPDLFQTAYYNAMRAKIGLQSTQKDDKELIDDMLLSLQSRKVDFTLFFRLLSNVKAKEDSGLPIELLSLFHGPTESFIEWAGRYRRRLRLENQTDDERQKQMNTVNPLYILRNYLLEQAIESAKNSDFSEIEKLQRCMSHPFEELPEFARFAELPPAWSSGICVSCSS